MEFLDKRGTIKLQVMLPLMILPAIGGMSYGAALSVGPALGLFFLCFLCFISLMVAEMNHDEIQKLKEDNARLRDAVLAVSVGPGDQL
jgi:hypothetical protein